MADERDDDQNDDLEIDDADAERLLADAVGDDEQDERPRRRRARDDDDDDDSGLGEAGKRALDREKERRKAARAEAAAARQERDTLKAELETLQNGNKSDLQRLIDERDALKDQLSQVSSKAKRREIAEELAPEHASAKAIRLVAKYLAGSSDNELEASAEELFEQFAPVPTVEEKKPSRTPAKPRERLRGGGDPEEDDLETDPRKLADLIRKNR